MGRWVVCQSSSHRVDPEVLKKALSDFIAAFDFLDSDEDYLFGFRRILTDAVSLKGELVPPVLVSLVEKLRSVQYVGRSCELYPVAMQFGRDVWFVAPAA